MIFNPLAYVGRPLELSVIIILAEFTSNLAQVDRKLVKQTVMTSVYGVTYIGARDQIKRRLKERAAMEDDNELFACACYAAKVSCFTKFIFPFEMKFMYYVFFKCLKCLRVDCSSLRIYASETRHTLC